MEPIAGRTSECPSLEALAEAPASPEIERHIKICSHCRTELALFLSFENDQPQAEELASVQWIENELRRGTVVGDGRVPELPLWGRVAGWWKGALDFGWKQGFAVAASLLVVVAAAGLYLRQGGTPQPVPNAGGVVWRSGRVQALSPSGDISQAPGELKWEPVAGATVYRVELLQVDRRVIWSGESKGPSLEIPAAIRAQLKPGRAFEWRVTASNGADETVAASDLQSFHIVLTQP